jgi:hypothetical protein
VWSYIFILLIVKTFIIFGKKDGGIIVSKQIIADDVRDIP